MHKIRQIIDTPEVKNIEDAIKNELSKLDLSSRINPGESIAITAGSRGINHIDLMLKTLINVLKSHKAKPFIVPAMGSHGNGTAKGQLEILKSLNITEESMGVPICSSMEVMQIGTSSNGFPVYVDRHATAADHVVVMNRIKAHTEFEGPIESGLMKMMAIGLGKHKGCFEVHKQTVNFGYSKMIPEIGSIILKKLPVLFGLGIVENIYDETACIKACLPEDFYDTEAMLLKKAKNYMARLPFNKIDILIIDEMGKNISGTGMDTNVIGRIMFIGEQEPIFPEITRIVVLGLTPESHGNAIGIGLADFTTRDVIQKLDTRAMNTNAITAMTPEKARLPVSLETDREALEAALKTIGAVDPEKARIVHIKNTLEMEYLHISSALKKETDNRKDLMPEKETVGLTFDAKGRLAPLII